MTSLASPLLPSRDSAAARWARGRLPVEWMLLAAAACGWAALGALSLASGGAGAGGWLGGHAHEATAEGPAATEVWSSPPSAGAASVADIGAASVAAAGAMWTVMVAAMMFPTLLPAVRYVALMSRPARRRRMAAAFVVGYAAVWTAFGVAVLGVSATVAPSRPTPAVTVAVGTIAASAWELTRWKRRALARCCRTAPIRLRGWPAYRSTLAFGIRNGGHCLVACGPAMVVLALAGHPIMATIVVAAFLIAEKVLRRGAELRAWAAAAGLLLATASLTVSL